jgi:simple sugar transport system ATP-binding protein
MHTMRVDLNDIHKHFGPVRANQGITMTVHPGSIHGILGENGAGKSTLMKVLAGYYPCTRGQILLNHAPVTFHSPADARRAGIGMMYQEPRDFPPFTVLENFLAGQAGSGMAPRRSIRRQFTDLCREFQFELEADRLVNQLTIGQRQQIELLRLLSLGISTLILDEPTTGITAPQKETLFAALRRLAQDGRSILMVTHKLDDVAAICDRVSVLRDGRHVLTRDRPFTDDNLLSAMFGSPPPPLVRDSAPTGIPLLHLDHVSCGVGRNRLQDATRTFNRGEIVALAGLEGSGQSQLLRVAGGLIRHHTGEIRLGSTVLSRLPCHEFVSRGIVFLPADRLCEALVPSLSLSEHMELRDPPHPFLRHPDRTRACATQRIAEFRIAGTPDTPVEALSGGNQQRLLLSFIPPHARLLLLEHPTRGLDVESARWTWARLQKHVRTHGTTIAFSSVELDEIMAVADRVLVFFEGRVALDGRIGEVTAEQVTRAIAGKGMA